MLEKFLKALSKLAAIIQDHDRILSEIAGIEVQVMKFGKMKEDEIMNTLMKEIDFRKRELKAILEVSKTLTASDDISSIRSLAMVLKAHLEKYDELLTDYHNLKLTLEILSTANVFDSDPNSATSQEKLMLSVETLKTQAESSLTTIADIVPERLLM